MQVELEPSNRVAHGMQRDVYLHPDNSEWIIKLRRPQQDIPNQRGIDRLLESLGHVDKWRTQSRIDVMSMNPR